MLVGSSPLLIEILATLKHYTKLMVVMVHNKQQRKANQNHVLVVNMQSPNNFLLSSCLLSVLCESVSTFVNEKINFPLLEKLKFT